MAGFNLPPGTWPGDPSAPWNQPEACLLCDDPVSNEDSDYCERHGAEDACRDCGCRAKDEEYNGRCIACGRAALED